MISISRLFVALTRQETYFAISIKPDDWSSVAMAAHSSQWRIDSVNQRVRANHA